MKKLNEFLEKIADQPETWCITIGLNLIATTITDYFCPILSLGHIPITMVALYMYRTTKQEKH